MKKKHRLIWFEGRIGQYIIKNAASDLFNPPILIQSKQHAKALFLTQEKNHTYEETN